MPDFTMEVAYGPEDVRASCDHTSRLKTRMEARSSGTAAVLVVIVSVNPGRLAAVPGEY